MARNVLTEPEVAKALDRIPKDLHLLLVYLVSGSTERPVSKLNGTA